MQFDLPNIAFAKTYSFRGFWGGYLLFIKYLKAIIKCRGTFRFSGLFPVFTFTHDLVNVHFTQCTMPKPPISCVNPLKNDDDLCLRSWLGANNV